MAVKGRSGLKAPDERWLLFFQVLLLLSDRNWTHTSATSSHVGQAHCRPILTCPSELNCRDSMKTLGQRVLTVIEPLPSFLDALRAASVARAHS